MAVHSTHEIDELNMVLESMQQIVNHLGNVMAITYGSEHATGTIAKYKQYFNAIAQKTNQLLVNARVEYFLLIAPNRLNKQLRDSGSHARILTPSSVAAPSTSICVGCKVTANTLIKCNNCKYQVCVECMLSYKFTCPKCNYMFRDKPTPAKKNKH